MKNNLDDVKFTMLDQIYENIGSNGTYRINLIKTWFKTIIENIVNQEHKAIIALKTSIGFEKLVNKLKTTPSEINKSIKRFKTSEKTEIEKLINGVKFSDEVVEIYSKHHNNHMKKIK